MKIYFITRGFPSESNLMLGNYESVQARALVKLGHEVVNICAPSVYKSELHLFDRNRLTSRIVDGVKVYEIIGIFPYLLAKFFRPLWLSKLIVRMNYGHLIKEVIKKEGLPDVAHIHILYVAYFAIFSNALKGIPLVITEHWSELENDENHDISWMSKAYQEANAIIAVSNSLAQSVQNLCHRPVNVINNMVDDRFWKSTPTRRVDSKFHFITVGRLCDNKHYDMLIDAFDNCYFSDDTVLDIVGDGENKNQLERLIEKKKLGDRIFLHGLKSSDEVAVMLASSDCFVLSSSLETFGIVLIEAMAKGLPVITTCCGGPDEFVTSGTGVIVPKDDCLAFTSAMKKMRVETGNYDKEAIKQYCYDNFSQAAIAKQIIDVYNRVLKQ